LSWAGKYGGIDINEEVACEVVLPDGEMMWTGSAGMKGHEKTHPCAASVTV